MPRKNTRLGRKFGRLTTVTWIPEANSYLCKCDCGGEKIVKNSQLGFGTNSCGCLRTEEYSRRGGGPRRMRLNAIGRYYRRNATVRGLYWDLTNEQFEKVITNPCTYCGGEGSLGFNFTGIDRVDNTAGYTIENVQPACKRCNQARNNIDMPEFLDLIRKIYKNRAQDA